jgi:hypothetical protein
MAIVKASYTRNKQAIKASVRYYTHRPTIEGIRGTRELFGKERSLTKKEVYAWVNRQRPGTYFYRFVLSHDPKLEDTARDLPLQSLTRQALGMFARRRADLTGFAAVCHTDHSAVRHVHVIAAFSRKLSKADLASLRGIATAQATKKRQELDQIVSKTPVTATFAPSRSGRSRTLPAQIAPRFQTATTARVGKSQKTASFGVVFRSQTKVSASYPTLSKPVCRQCQLPSKLVWRDGDLRCSVCGYARQTQSSKRRIGYSKQEGVELSMRGWGSV